MKMLFLVSNRSPRGGLYSVIKFAEALDQRGHRVTLACAQHPVYFTQPPKVSRVKVRHQIPFAFKGSGFLDRLWSRLYDVLVLSPLIKNDRFDFVFGMQKVDAMRAVRLGQGHGIPVANFVFETPTWVEETWGAPKENPKFQSSWSEFRKSLLSSDMVIANSGLTKTETERWLGRMVDSVATPAVDVRAADSVPEQRKCYQAIYVGALEARKNVDKTIVALSQFKSRPPPRLVICGDGEMRRTLQTLARRLRVDCEFKGAISDHEKWVEMKKSLFMVFPSSFEGFGMPPAEALYCRIPCVASDLPIFRQVYGNNLEYCEPNTPEELAKKMEFLLEHPEYRKRRGVEGREYIGRTLSWKKSAEEIEKCVSSFHIQTPILRQRAPMKSDRRTVYPRVLEKAVYPLIEARKPKTQRMLPYLQFLRKTQWWSLDRLRDLQLKRLHSLLSHAYGTVPYYRKMFENLGLTPKDIGTVDDLRKLPLLTKAGIRENADDLVTSSYRRTALLPNATGGSTGEPLQFYTDKVATAWNKAAAHRSWEWAGYNIGDRAAYIWGAPQDVSLFRTLNGKAHVTLFRLKLLDAFNITEQSMDQFVREIRRFKPTVINAYASAVYLLAKYLLATGNGYIRPGAVLTTAETLYPHQRETIEEAFGCPIFDYYSGRDTSLHATECPHHSGYHMSMETAVVEFLDDGEPVQPGEPGEIVLTDLTNYAMPFIRYKIGDVGIPLAGQCPCGRGLPLMERVLGRSTDFIVTPAGKYVHGEFFTHLFYETEGFLQFQLLQKSLRRLVLKIVRGPKYRSSELKSLVAKMKQQCGPRVAIDVQFVPHIPPARSGKRMFVKNEVENFEFTGALKKWALRKEK